MGRQLIVNYSSDKPTPTGTPGGNAPAGCTIFCRNMSYNTTEETLRAFFSKCGTMTSVRIAKDADGYAKGFAHIDFESTDMSAKACELTGSDLDGRNVHIEYAQERGAAPQGGRGGFGGGNRGGRGGFGGGRGGFGGNNAGFGGFQGKKERL